METIFCSDAPGFARQEGNATIDDICLRVRPAETHDQDRVTLEVKVNNVQLAANVFEGSDDIHSDRNVLLYEMLIALVASETGLCDQTFGYGPLKEKPS